MGVTGLTTFTCGPANKYIFERRRLHNVSVVIDGNSLTAQLHSAAMRNKAAFGGDYDAFARDLECFFNALLHCGIKPYVLCDGGYPRKKMSTAARRLATKTRDASRLNPINHKDHSVFPLLLRDVFFKVLVSLNIEYVVCEWEADQEIAALSRYMDAPVISYDSDYFIYNVAYIPINCLDLKTTYRGKGKEAGLDCKMYLPDNFTRKYGLKQELLPLLGTLLGNDYVKRSLFSKFFRHLCLDGNKSKSNLGQCRIAALIEWLKNETYESAIKSVLSRYKSVRRQHLIYMIKKSCSSYTNDICKYLKDLNIDVHSKQLNTNSFDYNEDILNNYQEEIESTSDESSDSENYDDEDVSDLKYFNDETNEDDTERNYANWVFCHMKKGSISPRFYDLLENFTYIGSPQVEDFQLPDAHQYSLPILRYIYDLITHFEMNRDIMFVGRKYDKVTETKIPRFLNIPRHLRKLLNGENCDPGYEFFYYFLDKSVPKEVLDKIPQIPADLQMMVLSIIWMRVQPNLDPVFNEVHVYSIILCCIMLTKIIDKIGKRISSTAFNNKHSACLEQYKLNNKKKICTMDVEIESLQALEIEDDECIIAASVLLKYFDVDRETYANNKTLKKTYNRTVLHSYAQLQCCLQQLNYLNALTSEHFSSCNIHKLYNGSFIYNMYMDLSKRSDPLGYIKQILKYSPSVCSYFITLTNFIIPVAPKKNESFLCKKSNVAYTLLVWCSLLFISIIYFCVFI